jgi:hypothetical protein
MERQIGGADNMPIDGQLLGDEMVEPLSEPDLPGTQLDCRLPAAREAEKNLVVGIGGGCPRMWETPS